MSFGQLVIGPPGSGKTTYCNGVEQFLSGIGRKCAVVNLDPANDSLPYPVAIDIMELICLEDVMTNLQLGPNGGLVYCMEYLEKNMDWLQAKLEPLQGSYILFDCPGQVELYTHNTSVRKIVETLGKWDYRLCGVHLVDAHYCADPAKFISVALLSLSTMVQLELPHINVLSKIDLVEQYGKLAFNLEFYTDVLDLNYLLDNLDDDTPFARKYRKLNEALCEVVSDFSLVSFRTLNIQDKESVLRLQRAIDKSNGYVFGGLEAHNESIMGVAAGETEWDYERVQAVQNKYVTEEEEEDDE